MRQEVAKFLDFSIFHFFRARLMPWIDQYREEATPEDYATNAYRHIFMSDESVMERQAFQLTGVQTPFVAVWSKSLPKADEKFIGKNVLFRDILLGDNSLVRGRFVEFLLDYNLHAQSYFKDFIGSVNQDLEELDLQRFFYLDMTEYLPGYQSRIEFEKKDVVFGASPDGAAGSRNFSLRASYLCHVTVPLVTLPKYLDGIRVYLNNNKVWEYVPAPTP